MLEVTDGYVWLTGLKIQFPVDPEAATPTTNLATCPASNDEIVLLPLTSATVNWLPVKRFTPAECCAIRAASNEVIAPFWPPDLEGVTVYEPEPKPLRE
jgi:hypothetical protein